MNRVANILGLIGTAAAVAVLVLPTPVYASCHCYAGAPGCCGEDEPAGGACEAECDSQDSPAPSHCPQNCPHDCKAPCCSVQPTGGNPWCMAADFFHGAPAGLTSIPASQLPTSPTLDGLLRPPIA